MYNVGVMVVYVYDEMEIVMVVVERGDVVIVVKLIIVIIWE